MTPESKTNASQIPPKTFALLSLLLVSLSGCHSAFIQTSVVNQTDQPIQLFEVDYPSASFGGQNLAAHAVFHYRFKVIGAGPVKLIWTSNSGQDHSSQGPSLHENQEGILTIAIHSQDASWDSNLQTR